MFNTDQIELAARRVLDSDEYWDADGENAKAKLAFIKDVIAELERRTALAPAAPVARRDTEERASPVNLDRPKPARANVAAMADAADAIAAKWGKKLG